MCLHECGSKRRKGPGKESEGRGRERVTVSVSCALKENVLQILVKNMIGLPQVKSNEYLTVTMVP